MLFIYELRGSKIQNLTVKNILIEKRYPEFYRPNEF